MLGYGPDGALTRAGESDAEEHKITPCVSLISRSAALDTNHLKVDGVTKSAHQNQHAAVNTAQTGRADRRARHAVSEGLIWLAAHRSRPERHVAPLIMLSAKPSMSSTLLWGAAPCGTSAGRLWASASITGAVTGGVKAARAKSKLGKIEAGTVEVVSSPLG